MNNIEHAREKKRLPITSSLLHSVFFRDLSTVLPLVETWRLDKVDVYNNHAASYVNLIRLMEDSPKMKHLR